MFLKTLDCDGKRKGREWKLEGNTGLEGGFICWFGFVLRCQRCEGNGPVGSRFGRKRTASESHFYGDGESQMQRCC